MTRLLTASLIVLASLSLNARHHATLDVSTRLPKCGWIEGGGVRDVDNLSRFCSRFVPAGYQIIGAGARREHLWIETRVELAAALLGDDQTTRTLLKEWLERWKTLTGYRTASVTLMRNHREVAKAETTMRGDVVTIR